MKNYKYEFMDPRRSSTHIFYPKIRSNEETIRLIIEEGKSLARFGDGEFSMAFNIQGQGFKRLDERLTKRIWEVINSRVPNLLVAIAEQYGDLDKYSEQTAWGIREYMSEEVRKQHELLIPEDRVYSDAYHITIVLRMVLKAI